VLRLIAGKPDIFYLTAIYIVFMKSKLNENKYLLIFSTYIW